MEGCPGLGLLVPTLAWALGGKLRSVVVLQMRDVLGFRVEGLGPQALSNAAESHSRLNPQPLEP